MEPALADRPSARPSHRFRTGTVVAGGVVVALGATGTGLLVSAADDVASEGSIRIAATVAAVAGLLLLGAAPRRHVLRALVLSVTVGALVGAATAAVSEIAFDPPGGDDRSPIGPTDRGPAGGATIELRLVPGSGTGSGGGGGTAGPAIALPPGVALVEIDGGIALRAEGGLTVPVGAGVATAGPATGSPGGGLVLDGAPVDGAALFAPGTVVIDHTGAPVGVVTAEGRIEPASPTGAAGLPAPVEPDATDGSGAGWALALAVLALVFLVTPLFTRPRRPSPPASGEADDAAASADLTEAAGEGLAEGLRAMARHPDHRTAIIGAYVQLLAALAAAGGQRRLHETPHEHLLRVLGPLGVRPGPVHRLAELFVQARFTPRPMTAGHRAAAVDALQVALASLGVPADAT